MSDSEMRAEAAARLLRVLDERSRRRRRVKAPPLLADQLAFDLPDAPDVHRPVLQETHARRRPKP